MPEHGIPISLETPRGIVRFNEFTLPSYLRLTEFTINSAVRANVEAAPRQDGSVVPDAFRSGATPVMAGEAKSANIVDRTDMLDELRAHMVSILRADGILRWAPTGKPMRRLVVRCLEDPTDSGGFLKTFQLALVSRSAQPENDDAQTIDLTALDADGTGGFTLPTSFPIGFGQGPARGSGVVFNGGRAEAYPVIQLRGPLLNPAVTNLTTGRSIAVQGIVPGGFFLEVDMAPTRQSIRMNGDAAQSRIGSIDPLTADFWSLAEGANQLHFDADGWSAGHGCTVTWRDGQA